MSKERFPPPFFEGKNKYRSYILSYGEHLRGVREHNAAQIKSIHNQQTLLEKKADRSRRAIRREAIANPRVFRKLSV